MTSFSARKLLFFCKYSVLYRYLNRHNLNAVEKNSKTVTVHQQDTYIVCNYLTISFTPLLQFKMQIMNVGILGQCSGDLSSSSDSCDLGVSLVKYLEMIRKPVQTWAISLNQDEGEVIRLTEKKALLGILET